jgi:VanZ family protein
LCAGIFIQSSLAVPDIGLDWLLWGWLPMDKVAHGLIYALLSALICRAFNSLLPWQNRKIALAVTGMVLAALYGLSDEWHQSFVSVRTADPNDFAADLTGSIVGALIFVGLSLSLTRNRKAGHDSNHLP